MSNGKKGWKVLFRNGCRALSCFLPLFPVFFAENLYGFVACYTQPKDMGFWDSLWVQPGSFYGGILMCLVWVFLFAGAYGSIHKLRGDFLENNNKSGQKFVLTKVESTTADIYFTYFSLFILSFYGVDPTELKDCLLFFVLMILIIWVYVSNDLYYLNPVLTLMGYRSYTITGYNLQNEYNHTEVGGEEVEIKVLSRDQLRGKRNRVVEAKFNSDDYTVCKLLPEKKIK